MATGRFSRFVAPFQEADENFDLDPPTSFADNFIFMPVLVNSSMRKFFADEKQFVRPFTVQKQKTDSNDEENKTKKSSLQQSESGPKQKPSSKNGKKCKKNKINVREFVANVIMSPVNYGLPYESVKFKSKDGTTLMGFLLLQERNHERLPTIIFFHGNAGNIGDNLPCACALYEDIRCNILLFDYRGYGFSEGTPSERGSYWDAQAAFDFVADRPDLDSSQIVLLGQSLGGAIVIDLAIRSNFSSRIAGIIVENTFSSVIALLRDHTEFWLLKPLRLLVRMFNVKRKFPTIAKIGWVRCPTLFIVGLQDKVIPPSHSARLFSRCLATQKRMYLSEEGEHLSCFMTDEKYTSEIAKFLKDFVGRSAGSGGVRSDTTNNNDNDLGQVSLTSKISVCRFCTKCDPLCVCNTNDLASASTAESDFDYSISISEPSQSHHS